MDGQGQAPTATPAAAAVNGPSSSSTLLAMPAPVQVPLAGLDSSSSSSSTSLTPAAATATVTDLASSSCDRPDGSSGPAGLELAAQAAVEADYNTPAPVTQGAAIPPDVQKSLAAPAAATLNADAINAAGEAEHAARADEEAKVESAILAADDHVKHEQEQQQDDAALQRQRTPLTDLSLAQTNATVSAEQTPRSPPSPSSTSALSSVTASVAPSVVALATTSNQSNKESKEDEEGSEAAESSNTDRKPRSANGRNTARRAASSATLKEAAAASSSTSTSTSARRSDKPPSTSSASNGGRTRGTSAQGQPQRQSSRSKAAASTSASGSSSRPRIRQRGSPDPRDKDGNDSTPGTRRSRRTRQTAAQNGKAAGEEEESDDEGDGDEGVTRCVCGNNDDETSAFMIQCETCKAWQHGPCVGFKYENDCPDTYYCEQCRPDLHPSLTSRGKKHARSASASSRPANTTVSSAKEEKEDSSVLGRSTSSNKPASRDQRHRELSTSSLPATATSSGHPSYHRARSSADAAIISSFLDTSQHSPSPASPGSPGSNQGSSDSGKRPMYPPTSHFAAPQNPKRRSTMNSRDSAAFDESILLATQQAFRESRAMAMELGLGASKARKRKKRDDDDMEPVKEEEEDGRFEGEQSDTQQHKDRSESHPEDSRRQSTLDPSLVPHDDDEGEHDDEGEEQDEMAGDANGASAPRKRRRRRGAGALFTAPNKKRAASARAKKGAHDGDVAQSGEDIAVNSVQLDDLTSATEDEANARKRKRDDTQQDIDRAGSPAASHDTSAGSHSSSDKPLAQSNKRRKGSPSAQAEGDPASADTITNVPGSTLQVAIPTYIEDSAAPSPSASAPPAQADGDEAGKQLEQVEALTNGLLAVTAKGKKALETEGEGSTPAPATQEDDSNATTVTANGKVIKQPNQYTYKRGGPGSRGGLKGSPSKRAALAAAAEARHGKHRDDTPSTYEDWINQPPSWGIPDHLSHLSHLLPSQSPLPLQVPKFLTSPVNSAAASPITPQVEAGAADPNNINASTPTTPAITISSSLEPSAKIRFPSRRMSIAEMRKRAKSMLDYLARVQVDTIDRNNRNRALAAVQESILSSHQTHKDRALTPPTSMLFNKESPMTPQAASLIEDLSQQLNSFQDKFL